MEEIEQLVTNSKRYKSIAEFIGEAVRLRLEELETHLKEGLRPAG